MEKNRHLGIYLAKDRALAVLLSPQGPQPSVLSCCGVSQPDTETSPGATLASELAAKMAERKMQFGDANVALDSTWYTQHEIHSELTDARQIGQTIRFDAEEVIATDATDMAVTFQVTQTHDAGSDVTVFTSDRYHDGQILIELQQQSIDPVSMEPDVVCLNRFLACHGDTYTPQTVFAVVSHNTCYLMQPTEKKQAARVRSFLVNPDQDLTAGLSRQLAMTLMSTQATENIQTLVLAGRIDRVNTDTLRQRTGLDVRTVDLMQWGKFNTSDPQTDPVELAIAYGSALGEIVRGPRVDFREDFAPFQGRRRLMRIAGATLSVAATLVLVTVALTFQVQLWRLNHATGKLTRQLKQDYKAVMFGQDYRKSFGRIDEKLKREFNKLSQIKKGLFVEGDESVSAKLTFILEALTDEALKSTDMKIDEISISSKAMGIYGDTASRRETLILFKAIDQHPKLKRSNETLKQAVNRDSFRVYLELENR